MSEILVIAEHRQGVPRAETLEVIGVATQLNSQKGGRLAVAVIANEPDHLAGTFSLEGVDEVIAIKAPSDDFQPELYEAAISTLIEKRQPAVVMVAHSVDAWSYAPAVAARTDCGFASDVFDVTFESDGSLIATRAGYKEKLHMELDFPGKATVLLTIRANIFAPAQGTGEPMISHMDIPAVQTWIAHDSWKEPEDTGHVDIAGAEFILSIGRGVGEESEIEGFQELADQVGATLGCSRPIADAGWLPKAHQVGQSGQLAANCKLYVAFGISGAIQHQWGMKHVPTIVAVNSDPDASIFAVAQYGIVGDLFEIAEELKVHF